MTNMQVVLSSQSKVSVVKVNNGYHVNVKLESDSYIHNFSFETVRSAGELASKILKVSKLDLQHWTKHENTSDLSDKFLIHHHKKSKAHLWEGLDTFCHMWITGGLGDGYNLFDTDLDRRICTMCCNQQRILTLNSGKD
ncbi:hypothetical protein VB713_14265 [Anabaena cylindrica UHCC 0172]|uniref:hypothetical protein n=1 Tax=Anabaena cylindrica TaxID=1165 RepID=UPI002B20102F|nr:hypothetical protein [Anabaena cylindrica]MEA5552109.1 hypothetical protein [Anabaena cylindrica UHCC 0172]